jgi:CRISPR-associated protein Cas6
MYWEEDQKTKEYEVPDDVVEVLFKLDCKTLPVDHNLLLSQALIKELPWMATEKDTSIQHVHIAEEANGWFRPEDAADAMLHLSRRAKVIVRIPKKRLEDVKVILGKKLDVNGHQLILKSVLKNKKLSPNTTLNSRFIVTDTDNESIFTDQCAKEISGMGVTIKKLLSGKVRMMKGENGLLMTRSLMLADLSKEDSILLQQNGIGKYQLMGCGIFIPHKGIEAVNKAHEQV